MFSSVRFVQVPGETMSFRARSGREFVVVDGDELAACRRVAALLGQSCHLVVANAGVYACSPPTTRTSHRGA